MKSYYCIVNTLAVSARDIVAVDAADDAAARLSLDRLAAAWPGFEIIALFDGERPVDVLSNPRLGFAIEALRLEAPVA